MTTSTAVDAAFERLFGYSWTEAVGNTTHTTERKKLPDDQSQWTPQQQQLCQIFGSPVAAAQILAITVNQAESRSPGNDYVTLNVKHQSHVHKKHQSFIPSYQYLRTKISQNKVNRKSNTNVSRSQQQQQQTEQQPTSDEQIMDRPPADPTQRLQTMLALQNKKHTTTVEQTSASWNKFKSTNTALSSQLEEQAESKTAYLKRQDFLQRVDTRKFELEKQQRDAERAKQGK